MHQGARQQVLGLCVNDQVSVPRDYRRKLRAEVHQISSGQKKLNAQESRILQGKMAFLKISHPEEFERLKIRLDLGSDLRLD